MLNGNTTRRGGRRCESAVASDVDHQSSGVNSEQISSDGSNWSPNRASSEGKCGTLQYSRDGIRRYGYYSTERHAVGGLRSHKAIKSGNGQINYTDRSVPCPPACLPNLTG